ncbi:response regulator transcription factor [Burkholderia pseudomultivorans]|uniref:response regulator n=1 Tax=Burkholderia pseudomultivorans TaxID=1207504 RepID=UPI0001FD8252|nr:response regulator transcription factor [Burkholderia pseudomultivorans]EGC99239.1 putative response regulator receiver domain protein [Burkholderia sp. TJI49]AOI88511.1 two-component system response regulator [Burkholderia pseudomultivorans]KVC26627.1 two-component system response regulator [Burkholderia pseudomultivorans]KVC29895.1 two-component system response regulator [Burkholderia pseudomultivorans]KVC46497.1 two-component system response regulator [Burkholderia pseudomultivorans]
MNASPSPAALRVFLVDHAAPVRRRIALLVGAIRGVVVVGEAEDGQGAWAHIHDSRAEVVIVDLRLADGSGLELIGMLSKAMPRIVTIVLTNHSAPAFREACATAGADYFFDKTAEFDAACRVIESLVHARMHHP